MPDFNLEARVKTINLLPLFPASSAVMDEGLKMSAAGHLSLEMLQSSGLGLVYASDFYLVNPIKLGGYLWDDVVASLKAKSELI